MDTPFFCANTVLCGLMSPGVPESAQIKTWLSVSHKSNGFTFKIEGAGGVVLFSKFSIFTFIFFVWSLWIVGEWFQKGRQFGELREKIDF